MASSSLTAIDMERNPDQQTEKKKKKKGVRASFKKGWRAVKGCCSCTQSNDLDPSEEPYLPVLNPVVLADTADHPGCDLEQTPLEEPVDPPQDPSGLKQTAPEKPTDDTADQQTEKKKKKKGVRASFKKGWRAVKGCCSCTQSNDLDPSEEPYVPVLNPVVLADTADHPGCDLEQTPLEEPVDPPQDPSGLKQTASEEPTDDTSEQQTNGKKKKNGVRARFKKGWQAMKHSCARNNKVVPLPTQFDLDPSVPQPAPVHAQPTPEDPQPENPAEDRPEVKKKKGVRARFKKGWQVMKHSCTQKNKVVPLPTPPVLDPSDPQPTPLNPQPTPVNPQPAEDPQPTLLDPQPAHEDSWLEAHDKEWRREMAEFKRCLSDFDPAVQRILECFPPPYPLIFPAYWYSEQSFLFELDKFEAFSALYEVGKKCLGKGHGGIVYQGTRKSDGLKVAIKFMYKSLYRDRFIHVPGYDKPLVSEVAVNLMLQKPERCPNIVDLLDWFEEEEIYILVLEYPYPCLSLKDFLSFEYLSEDQARPLMRQAVNAAQHCIDHDVCHGSLKMRNTVINIQTMTLMFIDFGRGHLASTWGKPDPEHPKPVHSIPAPTWVEPSGESWGRGHAVADTVFSLAKLLLCMIGGTYVTLGNDVTKDSPELTELGLTEECLDLIYRSGIASPPDRPTLEEFLEHEWFMQG